MIEIELITLTGSKLQEKIYEVILPTADGGIAVYKDHMPLVTLLVPGVIAVRRNKNSEQEYFATNGGVAEIGADTIQILVDEADHADDILESEAEQALERAKQLKAEAKDQIEIEQAQSVIDRQAVRLRVAELRRRRKV